MLTRGEGAVSMLHAGATDKLDVITQTLSNQGFVHTHTRAWRINLKFPNAVVLNAVGHRNMPMCAKERKRAQKSANARAQKGAKERKRALPRKNCKQPDLKQQVLELPNKKKM